MVDMYSNIRISNCVYDQIHFNGTNSYYDMFYAVAFCQVKK